MLYTILGILLLFILCYVIRYYIKKPINIFVDFQNGNDKNSGKSWKKAKATLQGGCSLVPYVCKKPVTIDMRGTCNNMQNVKLEKSLGKNSSIHIDGGKVLTKHKSKYPSIARWSPRRRK
jgi:hypothetical protein